MFKKLDSKLFTKGEIIENKEMNDVVGGATNNSGDGTKGTNMDSRCPDGTYDIAILSLWDIYTTKTKDDKPAATVEAPMQIASFSVSVMY
jgi:hypothetical protein